MKNTPIRMATLVLAIGLSACGGGDDATSTTTTTTPPPTETTAEMSCEPLQFSSAAGVAVPTSSQLATFAGTYTVGATTVVLSSSGTLTVNAGTIDVKSICYVTADNMIMVSWGNASTVGAGNILYDSHIDFRAGGISGIADGVILSPAT